MQFVQGQVFNEEKTDLNRVRCVRGSRLQRRVFRNNNNGTITYVATGLNWERGGEENNQVSWTGAASYCTSLSLGKRIDWRVPSVKELVSILGFFELEYLSINRHMFGLHHVSESDQFWINATSASNTPQAWTVRFYTPDSDDYTLTSTIKTQVIHRHVKCVNGQI